MCIDNKGFQDIKRRKFQVMESWLRGVPKKLTSNRPISQLPGISLRDISISERGVLQKH